MGEHVLGADVEERDFRENRRHAGDERYRCHQTSRQALLKIYPATASHPLILILVSLFCSVHPDLVERVDDPVQDGLYVSVLVKTFGVPAPTTRVTYFSRRLVELQPPRPVSLELKEWLCLL